MNRLLVTLILMLAIVASVMTMAHAAPTAKPSAGTAAVAPNPHLVKKQASSTANSSTLASEQTADELKVADDDLAEKAKYEASEKKRQDALIASCKGATCLLTEFKIGEKNYKVVSRQVHGIDISEAIDPTCSICGMVTSQGKVGDLKTFSDAEMEVMRKALGGTTTTVADATVAAKVDDKKEIEKYDDDKARKVEDGWMCTSEKHGRHKSHRSTDDVNDRSDRENSKEFDCLAKNLAKLKKSKTGDDVDKDLEKADLDNDELQTRIEGRIKDITVAAFKNDGGVVGQQSALAEKINNYLDKTTDPDLKRVLFDADYKVWADDLAVISAAQKKVNMFVAAGNYTDAANLVNQLNDRYFPEGLEARLPFESKLALGSYSDLATYAQDNDKFKINASEVAQRNTLSNRVDNLQSLLDLDAKTIYVKSGKKVIPGSIDSASTNLFDTTGLAGSSASLKASGLFVNRASGDTLREPTDITNVFGTLADPTKIPAFNFNPSVSLRPVNTSLSNLNTGITSSAVLSGVRGGRGGGLAI